MENKNIITGTNPVMKGDFPDPDVIRLGNTNYNGSKTTD